MKIRPPMRQILWTLMASLVAGSSLGVHGANATENGAVTTPHGVFDFGAGMMPPPTPHGTVGLRASYYSANKVKDSAGHDSLPDFKLNVSALSVAYIKMTEKRLLGANVGLGGIVPVLDISGHLTVPTPGGPLRRSSDTVKLGDIQVFPVMLQWAPISDSLFINASAMVQAPTGSYDVNRLFNPGTNHWTFAPIVGLTYLWDNGFEVSSNIEVDLNTSNQKTDYQSGIEYKHEFAAGQHFGPVTLGLGGYWYQQISNDSGPRSGTGNRGRVFALGPAISYLDPGMPLVTLHAYKEFGARNHSQGQMAALRIAYSF